MKPIPSEQSNSVGPVLEVGDVANAIVTAIRKLNKGVVVLDRGSYLRVSVPMQCTLKRSAVEQALGRPFLLPGDLELCMPSFKGKLTINEEEAIWAFGK